MAKPNMPAEEVNNKPKRRLLDFDESDEESNEEDPMKAELKYVKNVFHCFILILQVQKWAFRGQGRGPPWFVEDQETRVPHLDRLVKKFLCVPATSTQAERVFSWMGWLLNKRRFCLSGESVNSQTLLEGTLDWLIFTLSTINWSISKMDLLKSEYTCFRLFNYYLSLFFFHYYHLSFMENYHLSIHIGKNQWLIGYQISLIIIARQPRYHRFYALLAILSCTTVIFAAKKVRG